MHGVRRWPAGCIALGVASMSHRKPEIHRSLSLTPNAAAFTLAAACLFAAALPRDAHAKPKIDRRGGQIDGVIGGSNCIPGKAQCRSDDPTLNGATRGSIGGGVAIGWRPLRFLSFGAMYRGGHLRTDYEIVGVSEAYDHGAQHSALAYVRPTLPIWRFDLGVNLAPGYSRQIFYFRNGDQDYSHGFTFLVGPVIDIFVTRRLFMGFEADFIFNAHDKVCEKRGNTTNCVDTDDNHLAPVHQVIYGFHIGFTFG